MQGVCKVTAMKSDALQHPFQSLFLCCCYPCASCCSLRRVIQMMYAPCLFQLQRLTSKHSSYFTDYHKIQSYPIKVRLFLTHCTALLLATSLLATSFLFKEWQMPWDWQLFFFAINFNEAVCPINPQNEWIWHMYAHICLLLSFTLP